MQTPRRNVSSARRRDEQTEPEPLYITEDGYRKLQERLARMKKAAPDLAAEAARTAAYGDRSDNAEYKEAKRILRGTNYGILRIEDELKRAVIIRPGRNADGTVQLGSKIILEIIKTDDGNNIKIGPQTQSEGVSEKQTSCTKKFEIVGPHETDPARGRISHESPLGAALIGHVAGDEIFIKTAGGMQTYRIIEVR